MSSFFLFLIILVYSDANNGTLKITAAKSPGGTYSGCFEPTQSGFCHAAIPRWTYNSITKKCEKFTYSGCQGNNNNFQSKEHCLKNCGGFRPNNKWHKLKDDDLKETPSSGEEPMEFAVPIHIRQPGEKPEVQPKNYGNWHKYNLRQVFLPQMDQDKNRPKSKPYIHFNYTRLRNPNSGKKNLLAIQPQTYNTDDLNQVNKKYPNKRRPNPLRNVYFSKTARAVAPQPLHNLPVVELRDLTRSGSNELENTNNAKNNLHAEPHIFTLNLTLVNKKDIKNGRSNLLRNLNRDKNYVPEVKPHTSNDITLKPFKSNPNFTVHFYRSSYLVPEPANNKRNYESDDDRTNNEIDISDESHVKNYFRIKRYAENLLENNLVIKSSKNKDNKGKKSIHIYEIQVKRKPPFTYTRSSKYPKYIKSPSISTIQQKKPYMLLRTLPRSSEPGKSDFLLETELVKYEKTNLSSPLRYKPFLRAEDNNDKQDFSSYESFESSDSNRPDEYSSSTDYIEQGGVTSNSTSLNSLRVSPSKSFNLTSLRSIKTLLDDSNGSHLAESKQEKPVKTDYPDFYDNILYVKNKPLSKDSRSRLTSKPSTQQKPIKFLRWNHEDDILPITFLDDSFESKFESESSSSNFQNAKTQKVYNAPLVPSEYGSDQFPKKSLDFGNYLRKENQSDPQNVSSLEKEKSERLEKLKDLVSDINLISSNNSQPAISSSEFVLKPQNLGIDNISLRTSGDSILALCHKLNNILTDAQSKKLLDPSNTDVIGDLIKILQNLKSEQGKAPKKKRKKDALQNSPGRSHNSDSQNISSALHRNSNVTDDSNESLYSTQNNDNETPFKNSQALKSKEEIQLDAHKHFERDSHQKPSYILSDDRDENHLHSLNLENLYKPPEHLNSEQDQTLLESRDDDETLLLMNYKDILLHTSNENPLQPLRSNDSNILKPPQALLSDREEINPEFHEHPQSDSHILELHNDFQEPRDTILDLLNTENLHNPLKNFNSNQDQITLESRGDFKSVLLPDYQDILSDTPNDSPLQPLRNDDSQFLLESPEDLESEQVEINSESGERFESSFYQNSNNIEPGVEDNNHLHLSKSLQTSELHPILSSERLGNNLENHLNILKPSLDSKSEPVEINLESPEYSEYDVKHLRNILIDTIDRKIGLPLDNVNAKTEDRFEFEDQHLNNYDLLKSNSQYLSRNSLLTARDDSPLNPPPEVINSEQLDSDLISRSQDSSEPISRQNSDNLILDNRSEISYLLPQSYNDIQDLSQGIKPKQDHVSLERIEQPVENSLQNLIRRLSTNYKKILLPIIKKRSKMKIRQYKRTEPMSNQAPHVLEQPNDYLLGVGTSKFYSMKSLPLSKIRLSLAQLQPASAEPKQQLLLQQPIPHPTQTLQSVLRNHENHNGLLIPLRIVPHSDFLSDEYMTGDVDEPYEKTIDYDSYLDADYYFGLNSNDNLQQKLKWLANSKSWAKRQLKQNSQRPRDYAYLQEEPDDMELEEMRKIVPVNKQKGKPAMVKSTPFNFNSRGPYHFSDEYAWDFNDNRALMAKRKRPLRDKKDIHSNLHK